MQHFDRDMSALDRRSLILFGGQLVLLSVLVGRLQYLQIIRSDEYKTLADDNRVNVSLVAPQRGIITDRRGAPIAFNKRNFQVRLIPEQAGNVAETLRRLGGIIGMSQAAQSRALERVRRNPGFSAITIADNIDWERFARVNAQLPYLPGVEPYVGEKRYYDFGARFAHTVGYVGDSDQPTQIADLKVGKSGLERSLEEALRGQVGAQSREVNALGRVVRELSFDPGTPGATVELTIDTHLQRFAFERLGAQSGAVVVQDIVEGDVLAMVSTPSFDPNMLVQGIDDAAWQKLLDDEKKPLLNKAVRGSYSPGSTFKMLVALAAMERGVVRPEAEIICTGTFDYARERYHCWQADGHGAVDMVTAIERSCDVYFYDLAVRTGIDDIERMAKRFGLGQPTGIELVGEQIGIVPGRDWKRAAFEEKWRHGDTIITAIGQGDIQATPLQMTAMIAQLAMRGDGAARPRLVRRINGAEQPIETYPKLNFKPRQMDIIHRGMRRVVNRRGGTAFNASLLVNRQRMAGKTGTVQVRRIDAAERRAGVRRGSALPWALRDHAIFIGFAPMHRPRFALTVVVEHGGSGGLVAAPIARDVMVETLRREQ